MQIRELSKPVSSKKLNENMARSVGVRLNLEKFNDVQLEDARNQLRTEMSQFEMSESFDSVQTSPAYNKVRMLHDVINAEIMERQMNPEDKAKEDKLKSKYDKSGMKKNMQKQYGKNEGKGVYFATIRKKAMDHSVPEGWIANAIERMELGESDQEELSAELQLRYDLSENVANHIVYLEEGEEEEAKIIMSTKDMVDRVTGWLDDVSAMKAEQLLQLIDSIRELKGSQTSEQYTQVVRPSLEELYSALEATRAQLQSALGVLKGEGASMMGAPEAGGMPAPGEELGMPGEEGDLGGEIGGEPGAEMGASAEMAPAGREKRESVDYSRRLGILLAASKKK